MSTPRITTEQLKDYPRSIYVDNDTGKVWWTVKGMGAVEYVRFDVHDDLIAHQAAEIKRLTIEAKQGLDVAAYMLLKQATEIEAFERGAQDSKDHFDALKSDFDKQAAKIERLRELLFNAEEAAWEHIPLGLLGDIRQELEQKL